MAIFGLAAEDATCNVVVHYMHVARVEVQIMRRVGQLQQQCGVLQVDFIDVSVWAVSDDKNFIAVLVNGS